MSFTTENERQKRTYFLDVQVTREDQIFNPSVYHKPTCRGVHTHLDSFLPSTCTFGTVYKLA